MPIPLRWSQHPRKSGNKMLRSVNPQTVSQWTLIGLNKTHRALVRRTVESYLQSNEYHGENSSEHVGAPKLPAVQLKHRMKIDWTVLPSVSSLDDAIGNQCTGVMVVERKVIQDWLESASFENNMVNLSVPVCSTPTERPILLVWNWHPHGNKDVLWSTMLEFSGVRFVGVIHDIATLQMWCRSATMHGASQSMQTNPILKAANLPAPLFENHIQGELR